jgi:predicted Zn-dependent peptidase
LFGTLDELADEPRAIAAISAADILSVARESLVPDRSVWGVVRGAGSAEGGARGVRNAEPEKSAEA